LHCFVALIDDDSSRMLRLLFAAIVPIAVTAGKSANYLLNYLTIGKKRLNIMVSLGRDQVNPAPGRATNHDWFANAQNGGMALRSEPLEHHVCPRTRAGAARRLGGSLSGQSLF
jgi:hypothetical protein